MALTWRDLESFSGVKDKVMMFYFEGQFSFEDEEKLTRVDVGVPGLVGAGRHELFDDAEFRRFDEVPTVAVGALRTSPLVMLGRFYADDLGGQSSLPEGSGYFFAVIQITVLP
jgi:hypothetical protein